MSRRRKKKKKTERNFLVDGERGRERKKKKKRPFDEGGNRLALFQFIFQKQKTQVESLEDLHSLRERAFEGGKTRLARLEVSCALKCMRGRKKQANCFFENCIAPNFRARSFLDSPCFQCSVSRQQYEIGPVCGKREKRTRRVKVSGRKSETEFAVERGFCNHHRLANRGDAPPPPSLVKKPEPRSLTFFVFFLRSRASRERKAPDYKRKKKEKRKK